MNNLINILCFINLIIAVVSLPPCLMAGLMGLSDSPLPHKWYNSLFEEDKLYKEAIEKITPSNKELLDMVDRQNNKETR